MNKAILIIVALLLAANFISAEENKKAHKMVSIEIINDARSLPWITNINWHTGMTALEALQRACPVETKPAGEFIFVTAINKIEGKRGDKAWYFKINGTPARTLAIHTPTREGDRITWELKQDVCSCKVDGTNK